MNDIDVNALAEAIARAVKEALSGLTISVDKSVLGYVAAQAINDNRRAEGRTGLDL